MPEVDSAQRRLQDIRTRETFREFELEFDWMLKADGNSGVKYLVQKVDEWVNKDGRQARARGLEYQLADDHNADAASGCVAWRLAVFGDRAGAKGGAKSASSITRVCWCRAVWWNTG